MYTSLTSQNHNFIIFLDCIFVKNVPKSDRYGFILPAAKEGIPVEGRGRGGGMFITIQQYTNHTSVFVIDSRFERNEVFLGAGLSAEIEGNGNMVNIINTRFVRNGYQNTAIDSRRLTGLGGGVYLSFDHHNNPIQPVNVNDYTMLLRNVTFNS